VNYRQTSTYDANGNRTQVERDDNADGMVDFRTTYPYDANGNLIKVEQDPDGDGPGTVNYRETYTSTAINRWGEVMRQLLD
jgi:uncharacterized protein RhaS with RHS repeats